MTRTKSLVSLFSLVLLGAAASASPAVINTATIRAHVLESYPDCTTCSLVLPHGCFVVLDVDDGPITAHLPPVGGVSCSVAVDACIEATGTVANMIAMSPYVSNLQLNATTWSDAGSLCDE
jgi:hypothetical protein